MHTRKALSGQYEINFSTRPLPSKEEAVAARVERQVRSIKEAMGTMAFEGYLGTVRAIKERPDGDVLLAAAPEVASMPSRGRRLPIHVAAWRGSTEICDLLIGTAMRHFPLCGSVLPQDTAGASL